MDTQRIRIASDETVDLEIVDGSIRAARTLEERIEDEIHNTVAASASDPNAE